MKEIVTSMGNVIVVDNEDYERCMQYKWYSKIDQKNIYAKHNCKRVKGKTRVVLSIHRFILNITDRSISVDHIDGNGLNNRKSNLRVCSHLHNSMNKTRNSGVSKYKGVCWHKCSGKWSAYIMENGNRHHLGLFTNMRDAARVYDFWAAYFHKDFACFNFKYGYFKNNLNTI